MKGKIIAIVKPEKMDVETKDKWQSHDGESLDDFKTRMQEGGSDPANYNYTDPVSDASEEEANKQIAPYQPYIDVIKSVKDDLLIAYLANKLGLMELSDIKDFLSSAAKEWKQTIPAGAPDIDVGKLLPDPLPIPPPIEEKEIEDQPIEEGDEEVV